MDEEVLQIIATFSLLFLQVKELPTFASPLISKQPKAAIPAKVKLDTHLPVVSYNAQSNTNNVNHNNTADAGNLYYQGLKEATAYRATAYLDGFVQGDVR